MRRGFILFIVSTLLVAPVSAQAVAPAPQGLVPEERREFDRVRKVEQIQNKREATRAKKEAMRDKRDVIQNKRETIQARPADTVPKVQKRVRKNLGALQERRMYRREEVRKRSEAFKETLADRKVQIEARLEAKKEKLRDRLAHIKDKRKKEAVERINSNLDKVNAKVVTKLGGVLDRADSALEKISSRTDKAEENGAEVALVRSSIATALSKISAARSAVVEQSAKVYELEIVDESSLHEAVEAVRNQLRRDLEEVNQHVRDAVNEVKSAFRALRAVPAVDGEVAKEVVE